MKTIDKIIHLVGWVANVPISNILPSTHIKDDLNMDSIDYMLLIVRLERLFKVSLTNEEIERIETVKDANDCISRQFAV